MPFLRPLPVLVVVALGIGCAQMQANQRVKEYGALLDPLVGTATKDDVAMRFGIPYRRETLGTLELWQYHKSFGVRGGAYGYSPSTYTTYTQGSAHEVYDDVTLTFDAKGVLRNWQASAQR